MQKLTIMTYITTANSFDSFLHVALRQDGGMLVKIPYKYRRYPNGYLRTVISRTSIAPKIFFKVYRM